MFSGGYSAFHLKNLPEHRVIIEADNIFNGSNPPNNASIPSWTNLSISGNATEGTTSKQPAFRENILNGLPAVEFDSANSQCLQIASVAVGSRFTFFAVVEPITPNTFFVEQSADINSNDGFYVHNNGFCSQIKNGGVNVMTSNNPGWIPTDPTLIMIRYDGTTVEAWRNGVLFATGAGSISNNLVTNVLNIGSRNRTALFYDGYLYMMTLCNGALSNGWATLVRDYVRQKWAFL